MLRSQHMNGFAVLYDIATPEEAPAILQRIVSGNGIDAPEGMYESTYYFAWYLWPESPEKPRSDTHAWSAHPTVDLLGIVAGIRPAAPGYAKLRVAPVLGALTSLDATAATPRGPVKVSYRVAGGKLVAVIERPADLPGEFVWRGQTHPLTLQRTRLSLGMQ